MKRNLQSNCLAPTRTSSVPPAHRQELTAVHYAVAKAIAESHGDRVGFG
jgi:hypothetical protein